MHILHSCNWTRQVYDTDIFDLNDQCRLYFFDADLFHIGQQGDTTFATCASLPLAGGSSRNLFPYTLPNQLAHDPDS
jgi:hypothetical protein